MGTIASVSSVIRPVVITISPFYINYWHKFVEISQLPYFTQILSLLNIILILVTVFVSYLSWKASIKANELQLLPLLAIYFRGKSMSDRKIRIRNIGKSPAYDVKIESFVNIVRDIQKIWKLDLYIAGTNVLVPDEEKDLTPRATSNGEKVNMSELMIFHLDPEENHKRNRIGLIITFRNAEGNNYYSKVETGVGGLFISPAKRLNLTGNIYLKYGWCKEKLLLGWYLLKWKYIKPHIAQPKITNKKNT